MEAITSTITTITIIRVKNHRKNMEIDTPVFIKATGSTWYLSSTIHFSA